MPFAHCSDAQWSPSSHHAIGSREDQSTLQARVRDVVWRPRPAAGIVKASCTGISHPARAAKKFKAYAAAVHVASTGQWSGVAATQFGHSIKTEYCRLLPGVQSDPCTPAWYVRHQLGSTVCILPKPPRYRLGRQPSAVLTSHTHAKLRSSYNSQPTAA